MLMEKLSVEIIAIIVFLEKIMIMIRWIICTVTYAAFMCTTLGQVGRLQLPYHRRLHTYIIHTQIQLGVLIQNISSPSLYCMQACMYVCMYVCMRYLEPVVWKETIADIVIIWLLLRLHRLDVIRIMRIN